MFCSDILNSIAFFSENLDVANFLSTCKDFWSKRDEVFFYETYHPKNKIPKNTKNIVISNFHGISIPEGVVKLRFEGYLIDSIKGKIPKTVTDISLSEGFGKLEEISFPENIKKIEFGYDFDKRVDWLPNFVCLTECRFGASFNTPVAQFPPNLKKLVFGATFNQSLKGCLPKKLTHLVLGSFFNKPVEDTFPESLLCLKFGCYFNHSLKGCLPKNLLHLKLGSRFDQEIRDCLPKTLLRLTMGREFNQDVDLLPELQTLVVENGSFSKKISLPRSMDSLKLLSFNPEKIEMPESVNRLEIDSFASGLQFIRLPSRITHLHIAEFPREYPMKTWTGRCPVKNFFPKTLKSLRIECHFNQPIEGEIPDSITHLDLGHDFCQSIKGCIPGSVIYLKLGYSFDMEIKDCIPSSVRHLVLAGYLSKIQKGDIPNTVTKLEFLGEFNRPLKGLIPNSVTHLTLGCSIDQPLRGRIPKSVTHLTLGTASSRTIKGQLPNSVTHIRLTSFFCKPFDCIPSSVKYLFVEGGLDQEDLKSLPETISHFYFYENYDRELPEGKVITHLKKFDDYF